MNKRTLLRRLREMVKPFGLDAIIFNDVLSVGVQGDQRTVTPVACLIGRFPGHKVLDKLSSEISNALPINRVTYELKKASRPNI
jgi:hypothetical protein